MFGFCLLFVLSLLTTFLSKIFRKLKLDAEWSCSDKVKTTTYKYPSCLQTTSASVMSQLSSHTMPHSPRYCTSTLPSCSFLPPTIRTLKGGGCVAEIGQNMDWFICCNHWEVSSNTSLYNHMTNLSMQVFMK